MSAFDPAFIEEIRRMAAEGRKIDAIKRLRTRHALSLAEATDFLQAVMRGDDPEAALRAPGLRKTAVGPKRARRIDRGSLLAFLIFVTLGLALLGFGLWLGKREYDLKQRGVPVQATVVENLKERRGFTPVFAFEWEGSEKTVVSELTSSVQGRPVYEVGETVGLRVDPADPERFSTDDWFHSWFAPTLLGFIGGMLLLVGGGVSFLFLRR
ncbi:MAG: DUF3592 domain-containing protein [Akkermansiaceae bacterium]|nr:DUF3592 domain-containing protein [Akkermansiaceae bacterium]